MADMMKEHAAMMDKEEGQESGWKAMLTHILNNIHDRINYGTQVRKDATEEAADDEPKGFGTIKNAKK